MKTLSRRVAKFTREENGASGVEYGLLVALIAAVIIVVVTQIGSNLSNAFNSVDSKLPGSGS